MVLLSVTTGNRLEHLFFELQIFLELVKFVETTVRMLHASSPNKPIYVVGDSFGGCLALAVAARNCNIDLVLILANPGQTSDLRTKLFSYCNSDVEIHHVLVFYGLTVCYHLSATSFGRSQLQPLLSPLESLPDELHVTVPYLLSFIMGIILLWLRILLFPASKFKLHAFIMLSPIIKIK